MLLLSHFALPHLHLVLEQDSFGCLCVLNALGYLDAKVSFDDGLLPLLVVQQLGHSFWLEFLRDAFSWRPPAACL